MSTAIPNIKTFKIKCSVWCTPLVIDYVSNCAFIFMKESNLSQKRRRINVQERNIKNSKNCKEYYGQILCKLNKDIQSQKTLDLESDDSAYEIIKKFCPSIEPTDIPVDLKLIIVTFKTYYNEISKIAAGLYDNNLLEISSIDWSSYIDSNSFTVLNRDDINEIINEMKNNIVDFESSKDDLTEFIDDENDVNDQVDEDKE